MLVAHWLFTQSRFELDGRATIIGSIILAVVYSLYLIASPADLLRVDRWSVVTGFWDAWFRGHFPYAATTHLGNPIGSALPFHFYSALPFYAFPDMGVFALTGVLGFIGIVFLAIKDRKLVLAIVLAFALAPGVWWELAARSALIFNVALVLIFLLAVDHASLKTPVQIFLFGALGGLILSTRSVVVLPLAVYGSYRFLRDRKISDAIVFGAGIGLAFVLTFLPLVLLWNPQDLADNNPLAYQMNRYLPNWILPLCLIVSLVAGLTVTNRHELYHRIGWVLFLTVLTSTMFTVIQAGWQAAIFGSEFDISYFLLALPFALLAIPKMQAPQK